MATPEQVRIERLNDFSARANAALILNPGAATEARLRSEADASRDADWGRALDYLLRNRVASPAPPPAAMSADDFRGKLRALLESQGPYSQEVVDLLSYGRSQLSREYPDAYQLVQTWRQSHPPQEGEAVPDLPAPLEPTTTARVASVATKGGTVLTVASLYGYIVANRDQVAHFLDQFVYWLPAVTSSWGVVGVAALIGGLGGLLNGWLTYSGFVVPQFTTVDGNRFFMPGFLGNLLAGAAAAATTVGLATGPAPAPGDQPAQAVAEGRPTAPPPGAAAGATPKTRLTTFALLNAFLVGLVSANLLSLRRDRSLFSQLAGQLAAGSADLVPVGKVLTGADALRMLRRAGAFLANPTQPVPTGPMPRNTADRLALVRASVRKLLDRGRMADLFSRLAADGQPAAVKRDGSNIDMGVLVLDHPVSPALAVALKNLRVGSVVGTSLARLNQVLEAAGVDVAAEQAAISDAWATAGNLMSWFSQAPADWQLTPEQLG